MNQVFRTLHGFVRRYLSTIERLLVSFLLAWIVYAVMRSTGVYPSNWDIVITVIIFGVTIWSPALGYFLAIAAVLYPLYSISLYLAVIFLVIALIAHRLIIHNLGGALLTLVAPWISPLFLPWAIPVMGGLWWGAAGGALMGGFAALWGQIVAGMAGLDTDWVMRTGLTPATSAIVERFSGANSLETITLLVSPVVEDSNHLLFNLLQVLLWSAVGGVIATLIERDALQKRRPWGNILLAWAGILALAGVHLLLGLWLKRYVIEILPLLWKPLISSMLISMLIVALLEWARDLLEHPIPAPRRRRSRIQANATADGPTPRPVPPEVAGLPPENDADDLIMIELE